MLFEINCPYCDGVELKLLDIIIGGGTEGERTERVFKCYNCDEELSLDEVDIEVVR